MPQEKSYSYKREIPAAELTQDPRGWAGGVEMRDVLGVDASKWLCRLWWLEKLIKAALCLHRGKAPTHSQGVTLKLLFSFSMGLGNPRRMGLLSWCPVRYLELCGLGLDDYWGLQRQRGKETIVTGSLMCVQNFMPHISNFLRALYQLHLIWGNQVSERLSNLPTVKTTQVEEQVLKPRCKFSALLFLNSFPWQSIGGTAVSPMATSTVL